MGPIRILIAEGNPMICHALQRLLEPTQAVEIVALASDGCEALQLAGRYRPAVALLNVALPPLNGRSVITSLKERFPEIGIVALAIYPTLREEVLRAGACRFTLLDAPPAELIASIQEAAGGHCQPDDVLVEEESSMPGASIYAAYANGEWTRKVGEIRGLSIYSARSPDSWTLKVGEVKGQDIYAVSSPQDRNLKVAEVRGDSIYILGPTGSWDHKIGEAHSESIWACTAAGQWERKVGEIVGQWDPLLAAAAGYFLLLPK